MRSVTWTLVVLVGCGGLPMPLGRPILVCPPDQELCGAICIPHDGECCNGTSGRWCEAGRYCDRGSTCTLDGYQQCGNPDDPPSFKICKLDQRCTAENTCVSP